MPFRADGIFEAQNLSRRYCDKTVVSEVSFTVRPGEVFGLVGPNGAGKTTTLRMMLGLLRPSAGEARVFGQNASALDRAGRSRLGFVLEANGVYENLTVEQNLDFYAEIYGLRDRHRQVASLARAGKTVLLSSHNLREVEEACGTIAIMNRGGLRALDRTGALLAQYAHLKKLLVYGDAERQGEAHRFLNGSVALSNWTQPGIQIISRTPADEERVLARLSAAGLQPVRVEELAIDLNDVFDLMVR